MGLNDGHCKELVEGSGITPGQVAARGYRSITDIEDLKALGFGEDQSREGLLLPIWGVDAEIVGYQLKPDSPRQVKGKAIKYETPSGWRMRLDVGPNPAGWMDDPTSPLVVTEGIKKGDSALCRGLACVSLIGVWNWRGQSQKGGYTELADWDKIALRGRKVYICFDSDVMQKPPVKAALRRLAGMLSRRGATVSCILIPSAEDAKVGLDDWFVGGGTFRTLIEECQAPDLLAGIQIIVNGRPLQDVSEDALSALREANSPPFLFVRGGELVRVQTDEQGLAKIAPLSPAALRGVMARSASWVREEKKASVQVAPSKDVVDDVMALPEWPGIPAIEAVARSPVMARTGAIASDPGYDFASRFYIATLDAPEDWGGTAAQAAEWILSDVLGDFPFAGPADKAHALALMLLPIVRPSISGPTPLHLIDAPVQGTGKSLLARVLLMATCGTISATPGTKDEEEWRKKIATCLLEGKPYVFLDNLSRKVDSDSLAGALTATEWTDRGLSTMRSLNLPVRCVWVATANNAELSRDILRRTVWIRLQSTEERPEDRMDFRHADIEHFVIANRAKIVGALVAIAKAWVDARMPGYVGRKLGSFEEWTIKLGGIVGNAGVSGFLENLEELRSHADSDEPAWAAFCERWAAEHGASAVKAGDLVALVDQDDHMAGMLGDKGERSRSNRLGHLLKKRVGVVSQGLRIESVGVKGKSQSYALRPVGGDVGGMFGDVANQTSPENLNLFEQTSPTSLNLTGDVGDVDGHPYTHTRTHSAHAYAHTEPVPVTSPTSPFEPESAFNIPGQHPQQFEEEEL